MAATNGAMSEKQTTIEEGTELVGSIRSTGAVVVRGSLDGKVDAPSLVVASTGVVTGEVKVLRLRSDGVLQGTVEADEITLSGAVKDDSTLRGKRLAVAFTKGGEAAVRFGACTLEIGDEPVARPRNSVVPGPRKSAPPAAVSVEGANSASERRASTPPTNGGGQATGEGTGNGRSKADSFPPEETARTDRLADETESELAKALAASADSADETGGARPTKKKKS